MPNYELFYGSGGHCGPYPSLEEAVKTAVRLIKGSRTERSIIVRDRALKPEHAVPMTVYRWGGSRWSELHQRFHSLMEQTGADKSSSYCMNVIYDQEGQIGVELGTYDIADWPRSVYIGPFEDEWEALTMTELKIIEAEQAVSKRLKEDKELEDQERLKHDLEELEEKERLKQELEDAQKELEKIRGAAEPHKEN